VRIENKKAKFDYSVVEVFEAGLVLTGAEVKSLRNGGGNLTGSRVLVVDDGVWVVGMNIAKYSFSNELEYDPQRRRKLLLKAKEVVAIETKRRSAGLTLVPLAVYNKGRFLKMEVGLVRGKKKYEKREVLKKRDAEKGLREMLKKIKRKEKESE
jgi:SsrA-binding protein